MGPSQDVAVKIAGRDVIGSGAIVLGPDDDAVMLQFAGLTIKLIFEKGEKTEVFAEPEDASIMYLRMRNFDNALNVYWTAEIGQVDNRQLHIGFSVASAGAGKSARLFSYTFSLGEVINAQPT